MKRLLVIVVIAGCGDPAIETYSIDTLPNGAVHVANTGPAMWPDTSGWKIVLEAEHTFPLDSAGALDRPNYPHLLANGEMVVLNQLPPFIQRYGVDFTPLGRVGREGSGPGEYENPGMRAFGDSIHGRMYRIGETAGGMPAIEIYRLEGPRP